MRKRIVRKNNKKKRRRRYDVYPWGYLCGIAICLVLSAVLLFLILKTENTNDILYAPYGAIVHAWDVCPGSRTVLSVTPDNGAYILISREGVYFDEPGKYSLRLKDESGSLFETELLIKDGEAPYIRTVTQSVETDRIYTAEELILGVDKIDPAPRTTLSCEEDGVRILSRGKKVIFRREGTYTFKVALEDASGNRLEKYVSIRTRYAVRRVPAN